MPFLSGEKCEVCGIECVSYTSHPLEVTKSGEWIFHLQIHDRPTYFLDAIAFCDADCAEKWYQNDKKISI